MEKSVKWKNDEWESKKTFKFSTSKNPSIIPEEKEEEELCIQCGTEIKGGNEHCFECNHCSISCCSYWVECFCCCTKELHCSDCGCGDIDCGCSCCCVHCTKCSHGTAQNCNELCYCCCVTKRINTDGHKADKKVIAFLESSSEDSIMNLSYTSILGDEQILPEIGKFYMLQCLDNEDELREEFTRKLAQKILNYLVVSCAGEMRYCRSETVGNITDLGGDAQALVLTVMKEPKYGSRDFLWCVGYNLAQEFGYPRITQALFEIFDTFEWKSSSVGGDNWANIAKVANQFATGEFNDIIFVDGVMSIVHNSNWAFNKYYNKDCNYLGLQSLLDYKRDATRESIFKLLTDLGIKEKDCEVSKRLWEEARNKKLIEQPQPSSHTTFRYKYLVEMQKSSVPLSLSDLEYLTKIK